MKFTRKICFASTLLLLAAMPVTGCDQAPTATAQEGVRNDKQSNPERHEKRTSKAVQDLLVQKREDSLAVEGITDADLEIGRIDRWIKDIAVDAGTDRHRTLPAFSAEDLKAIRRGIEVRREQLFHVFVGKSLTPEQRSLLQSDAPHLLASIQQANQTLKEYPSNKAALLAQINELSVQAKSDPEIAKLVTHAANTAESFSHEDFIKQSQAKMKRAGRNASSVEDLIQLQVGALSDSLDQISEAVATESKKRWSRVNLQVHRFVWAKLSSEDRVSIGTYHYEYVDEIQKQLDVVRKYESDPLIAGPTAPPVSTVE